MDTSVLFSFVSDHMYVDRAQYTYTLYTVFVSFLFVSFWANFWGDFAAIADYTHDTQSLPDTAIRQTDSDDSNANVDINHSTTECN